MTREEIDKQSKIIGDKWWKQSTVGFYDSVSTNDLIGCAKESIEWADRTILDRVCRCYCDDICRIGMTNMCFHKHDSKGQVKNTFKYNECNDLKFIRHSVEQ